MTRRRAAAAAALLAAALAATGCTSVEGSGDKGYVSAGGNVVEVAEGKRGDPIELSGETVEGEQASVADLRGQPVVVPVWGPWCGPCTAEAPQLAEIAREYDGRAAFLGIDFVRDSNRADALTFQEKYDVPYPSLYSTDGSELLALSDAGLSPRAIPSLVFLDAEGRIASVILGEFPSPGTVTTLLDDLVEEAGGSGGSGGASSGGAADAGEAAGG